MHDDSDFDDDAHKKLLRSIREPGSVKKRKVKAEKPTPIDAVSLLSHLHVKRKSINVAKKSLGVASQEDNDKDAAAGTEPNDGEDDEKPKGKKATKKSEKEKEEEKKKKKEKKRKTRTLMPERNAEARKRVEASIAFGDLKDEMTKDWKDLVESNRVVDQLIFPLVQPKGFLLGDQKPDEVFTKEELEIRKAMDLRMAKDRLGQIQRMRALVSQQEAKNRYTKKIKSKSYHRIQRREKRRQMLKEFEDLLARDPAAAQEKLAQIENQRIIERGELKHRAKNRFQKEMANYASRNPEVKKMIDDHIRMGKELKQKAQAAKDGMENDEESDDDAGDDGKTTKSAEELLAEATMEADAESKDAKGKSEVGKKLVDAFLADPSSVHAKVSLAELRAQKRQAALARNITAQNMSEPLFDVDNDWTVVGPETDPGEPATKKKKRRKGKHEKADGENVGKKEAAKEETPESTLKLKLKDALAKAGVESEKELEAKMIDPKKFLQLTTSDLTQVSSEFVEKMEEFDEETAQVINEAFKDDDVIGDFQVIKGDVLEKERPKDVDLTLMGWGDWVGPGTTERKRRRQFIVKAKEKKRRDGDKHGVIIAESNVELGVSKLQPRSLPFPYTRVKDFETVLNQPLGIDWNPTHVRDDLCKRAVVVEGGRPILPINKAELLSKN